jgi:hypothetical protein
LAVDAGSVQPLALGEVVPEYHYFPQTGHWLGHGFLHYWSQFGDLPTFGYPISEEVVENGLTVQYFERARFEWHPGAWPERYDVLLGLLARDMAQHDSLLGTTPFLPISARNDGNCTFFPETGHKLCFGFRSYWQAHGGPPIFGYPISEEFRQNGFTVQYFERQRLEYHPENAPPWEIEGGLLGVQVLAASGRVYPPAPTPVFASAISAVSPEQQRAMLATCSWRAGCPVPISALRVLDLSYWGFDGGVHSGWLKVNADVAQPVVEAFRRLFSAGFPVRRMELVEHFNADDEQSMLADNTSAFNCRSIPGSTAWSEHAYGRAVDLNPFPQPLPTPITR